ncbi:MAG TPA: PhzF family phenazine biosynthesis isomerase [Actinocrinis sp.]|nr:PhzF family phenazine biosynthesis isomerase [Actinocrinis sp.]
MTIIDAHSAEVLRYAAFTLDPAGGNPAGVVPDAAALDDAAMQRIAAEVGYSETVFLRAQPSAEPGVRAFGARYFSPLAEVPFCGHATIAGAVALAEFDGPGLLSLATKAGQVLVETGHDPDGNLSATLTSVATRVSEPEPAAVAEALALLRWRADELDPALPVRVAYAGARHLVLAAATRGRLAELDYDFDGLADLMRARDWTTLQLVWRESEQVFHSRNPFPVGGVVEDPATGAAAAALGGYLRELGLVSVPATLRLHQGEDLGRPSLLTVDVPADIPGIRVTGTAVPIKE